MRLSIRLMACRMWRRSTFKMVETVLFIENIALYLRLAHIFMSLLCGLLSASPPPYGQILDPPLRRSLRTSSPLLDTVSAPYPTHDRLLKLGRHRLAPCPPPTHSLPTATASRLPLTCSTHTRVPTSMCSPSTVAVPPPRCRH
jgi:hypothetical protein